MPTFLNTPSQAAYQRYLAEQQAAVEARRDQASRVWHVSPARGSGSFYWRYSEEKLRTGDFAPLEQLKE